MAKLVMERKASDNKYLHSSFHISADIGITYVGLNFGDEAVIEYLTRFTLSYYKLLIDEIKQKGLSALKENIENIYKIEEAKDALHIDLNDNCLSVEIKYCPAIKYMNSESHIPSKWYIETTKTVNKVIAENCGYEFKLLSYDTESGKALYSFTRREQK